MDELKRLHKELSNDVIEHSKQALNSLSNLKAKTEEGGNDDHEEGMSFLKLKNIVMLDYLIDLTYVALKKISGESIEGEPAIERLVENRTVLEKMRPIESKLKYQIEKYVKIANGESVPVNYKPNPAALMSKFASEDEDEDSDEDDDKAVDGKENKNKLYKVPKNIPTYFNENPDAILEEEEKRERKKNLSRSLIEDLKRQHGETPEEEFHTNARAKAVNEYKERIRFEEENFIRLPMSKKEKNKNKNSVRFSTVNSIGDEVTAFGGFGFDEGGKKRKKKTSFKKSVAKKKFKARK